jgi:hypothetical protein
MAKDKPIVQILHIPSGICTRCGDVRATADLWPAYGSSGATFDNMASGVCGTCVNEQASRA